MANMPPSSQAAIPERASHWSFDIDHYLNPIIPRPRLHVLPRTISRFLGYRAAPQRSVPEPVIWFWAFVGTFLSIVIVTAIFRIPAIRDHSPPNAPLVIIGSFGATAILEYNACTSPLAQPRNVIFGQVLSALVGISITKGFMLLPPAQFQELRWLAGALAVSTSTVVMGITKTVHPPAGATALLAATSNEVAALGWFLVPMVLLGSVFMLLVACITNNIQRQFPMYWWTACDLRSQNKRIDEEKDLESDDDAAVSGSGVGKDNTWQHIERVENKDGITVNKDGIIIPSWLVLSNDERAFLEVLRSRFGSSSDTG